MSGLDLRDLIGESETEEENENEEENPLPVSVEPMTIVNNPESKQPDNNSNGIFDGLELTGDNNHKTEGVNIAYGSGAVKWSPAKRVGDIWVIDKNDIPNFGPNPSNPVWQP